MIVPGEIAGLQLSHLMLKPRVSEFIADAIGEGDFDFAELSMKSYPGLVGRTLGEIDLPRTAQAIVIALLDESGRQTFNPPSNHELQETDTMIVVCKESGLKLIEQR